MKRCFEMSFDGKAWFKIKHLSMALKENKGSFIGIDIQHNCANFYRYRIQYKDGRSVVRRKWDIRKYDDLTITFKV